MKTENIIQEFLLLFNPLSSLMLLLGIGLFFKKKGYIRWIVITHFTLSILLLANILFYKFFDDFLTIPLLFVAGNMSELGSSVATLFNPLYLLFFGDTIALIFIAKRSSSNIGKMSTKKFIAGYYLLTSFLFISNVLIAQTQRPELLTRSFDRQLLVKNIGIYNYQMYDLYLQTKMQATRVFADSNQLTQIVNYLNTKEKNKSELYGKYKGKNVIIVSMESLQSFVINHKENGQEITPFLNRLIQESYYFDNFYHQTGQGKTSDAEFLIENSLYPLNRGAVFFTQPNNVYQAMPSILKKEGYYSAVFHANNKSFWNRDIVYNSFGYDRFYNLLDYNVTSENSVGWGLKDKDFFSQTVEKLKTLPQPFYAKAITLTNHFPFTLGVTDANIKPYTSDDATFNNYFVTVNYMDQALEGFFKELKQSGLYDNSIIVLYGDHYGISENHNRAMGQYLGEEVTPYEHIQLQRTPLIIHVPGQTKGETISTVAGQIDIRPTLLSLLGKKSDTLIEFGSDIFAKHDEHLVVLRDGSVVTDQYIVYNNVLYNRKNGMVVNDEEVKNQLLDAGRTELDYSDKIIYGDLLRYLNK